MITRSEHEHANRQHRKKRHNPSQPPAYMCAVCIELTCLPLAAAAVASVLERSLQLCLHLLHKGREAGVQEAEAEKRFQVPMGHRTVAVHQGQRELVDSQEVLRKDKRSGSVKAYRFCPTTVCQFQEEEKNLQFRAIRYMQS